MSDVALYSLISVIIVSLLSFVGAFTLWLSSGLGRKMLSFLVSFSAGALLGDVFIHLLPELVEEGSFTFNTSLYILAAIVGFFVIEKYFHWHHHHDEDKTEKHAHPVVINNIIADGLHNFIDGLIIVGAFALDTNLGIATTIAVILHEIPQEIGDFGVLVYGGLSPKKALGYNFISALMAILGAVIGLQLANSEGLLSLLAAIGIGSFIYIATADLIPQIHKEKEKAFTQLLSFGLGIAAMFILLLLE
jgi:zinc and cadmium transporter